MDIQQLVNGLIGIIAGGIFTTGIYYVIYKSLKTNDEIGRCEICGGDDC